MRATSLFPDPDLPIEPAERPEPSVWVRRLVITAGRTPDAAVLREVSFRPGLNIIRVAARPPGETRPIGHSVGKTLLARLLRYSLGESHIAAPGEVNRITAALPDAHVVSEIRVAGQWWVVARPLRNASLTASCAVPADDWHAGLEDQHGAQRYADFADAVTQATFAGLPELRLPAANHLVRWVDLLGWLSRDHECSYRRYYEWRDPDAGSGTARLAYDDACLLMRWGMGLLNTREITERTSRQKLLSDLKTVRQNARNLSHTVHSTGAALARRLGLSEQDLVGGLLTQRAQETVESQIQSLQRLLTEFTEDITAENLREAVVRAAQAVAVAEDRLERAQALRETTEAELRQRTDSSREDYYATFDPGRTCPLDRTDCALHPANRTTGLPDPHLDACIAELRAMLKRHTEEIGQLERQLPELRRQRREAEDQHAEERKRRQQNINGTLTQIGRWQLLAEELREFEEAHRARTEAQTRADTLDRQIRESRERQEAARSERTQRHRRISAYFDWALKRLLGSEAGGTIRLDARGLHPAPDSSVAASGAAMTTLATVLGLDLACLAATVCGVSHLPGLLLHDSPKEKDIEPVLYERIFGLALELEQAYQGREPAFQYIITTTSPPPPAVARSPYVRLTLDARHDEGLLLGVRF